MTDPPGPEPRKDRGRWQVGLRTLVLLTAVVAAWLADFQNRRQTDRLRARLATARIAAHELVIDDPSRIAVVQPEGFRGSRERWEIYLPDGVFRVCLATCEVGEPPALAPPTRSGPIGPGRHLLDFDLKTPSNQPGRTSVTWDGGSGRLEVEEPAGWFIRSAVGPTLDYSASTSFPADAPVTLFRRRFHRQDPQGRDYLGPDPGEGVLLWIEPVKPSGTR